jgi:hypothetical protein
MNPRQIEAWALRIIDRVKSGQPNEDFLVELKRTWIPEDKAARRIAGHANSVYGESILWLIGVDEKEGVIGVEAKDLSAWYPKVESQFDGISPRLTPLNIPIENKTVVALLFETERAPFLVKNPAYGKPNGGSVSLEVPWRENTSVRSANRSDLIRLLTPLELLPSIEILDKDIYLTVSFVQENNEYILKSRFLADLYIVPRKEGRLTIPFHHCRVEFSISGMPMLMSDWVTLTPPDAVSSTRIGLMSRNILSEETIPGSLTIQSTLNEIIIDGPGKVSLKASAEVNLPSYERSSEIEVSIYLLPTNTDRPVSLTTVLPYPEEDRRRV